MPYTTVSLNDLVTRLQSRYDGVPFWTATDARRAINEALQVWQVATGYWRETSEAEVLPNDPFVVLRAPLVFGTRVLLNGKPLHPTSLFDLDNGIPNWQMTTGTPYVWAPVSLRLIAVYPSISQPSDPDTRTYLDVEGARKTPTILVDPADDVQIGSEEIPSILDYALWALAFSLGGSWLQAMELQYTRFWQAVELRTGQRLVSMPTPAGERVQDDPVRVPRG